MKDHTVCRFSQNIGGDFVHKGKGAHSATNTDQDTTCTILLCFKNRDFSLWGRL